MQSALIAAYALKSTTSFQIKNTVKTLHCVSSNAMCLCSWKMTMCKTQRGLPRPYVQTYRGWNQAKQLLLRQNVPWGNNDGPYPTTNPQAIGKADRLLDVLSGGLYADYASLLTADPQATDKAERCTVLAQRQKLLCYKYLWSCRHLNKLQNSHADQKVCYLVQQYANLFIEGGARQKCNVPVVAVACFRTPRT